MAVTEILGTDSLSSSRITLNDNFTTIEDEITSLKGYLDPTAATLSGVTVSTSQLSVDGGTAINATSATIGVATTILANASFGAAIIKSGVNGTAAAPLTSDITSFAHSAYSIDPTSGINLGTTATDGYEITLIATASGSVTGTFGGGTTATFSAANETLTLRTFNSVWYVISANGATVA